MPVVVAGAGFVAAVAKGGGAAPGSAAIVVPVVVAGAGFVAAGAKGGGAAPGSAAIVVPVVVAGAGFVAGVVAITGEFVVIVIIEGERPALAFVVVDVTMLAGAVATAAVNVRGAVLMVSVPLFRVVNS